MIEVLKERINVGIIKQESIDQSKCIYSIIIRGENGKSPKGLIIKELKQDEAEKIISTIKDMKLDKVIEYLKQMEISYSIIEFI